MPITTLVQHTRLPIRHLHHGLAALIQQNLIYHFYEKELDTTFYEANRSMAYFPIRAGKVLDSISVRYGSNASSLSWATGRYGFATTAKERSRIQYQNLRHERTGKT